MVTFYYIAQVLVDQIPVHMYNYQMDEYNKWGLFNLYNPKLVHMKKKTLH